MRILIVKLGAIGDIVHALPAVAAIRRNRPDVRISWVVEQRSAEILRGCELIDDLIEIDTRSLKSGKVIEEILLDISRQAKLVRRQKYDLSIDFQGLIKSAVIGKVSGSRRRWGFERNALREPAGRIFLTDTVKIPSLTHVIRKNLLLASGAAGFEYDDSKLEFPIATFSEHRAEVDAIIAQTTGKFAILNPAGGWMTKLWHAEKFGMLADRIWYDLGLMPVVVTGPNEIELAEKVLANSSSGKTLLTRPSLKGFYELARQASVYIGGDTGPTHIAIAAGARVIGIFGPTEWWRNGSLNPQDICVERKDIGCRVDCHRRSCSNWICMDIDVESILAAVKQRILVANLAPSAT